MKIDEDLIAACSAPIALEAVTEAASHGYAIVRHVREISGGRSDWPDGMLYPVLHRLERLGHLESR